MRLAALLTLITLSTLPAAANELAGCWEGTVGTGPPVERLVFVEIGDAELTLHISDGEMKRAPGTYTVDGGTLTATATRRDREIPITLTTNPDSGALEGTVTHPDAGEQPLTLRRVEPYANAKAALGEWSGTLEMVGLPLVLRVMEAPCGRLHCALDSPSQEANGMPCTSFGYDDERTVSFALSFLGASFTGTIGDDGDTLDGTFTQGGALPLTLVRGAATPELKRPQEPKPPFPYAAEDVTIDNDAAGITLAGTLTLPEGDGPHPLAIFITGSGPQDRDESLMNHKPFLLLADTLTRAGVAVLRTDDRGVGGSGGDAMQSTLVDFADDVAAQIAWAKRRPEIDGKRIGLLGHSEGGWVAPLVAKRVDGLAFLVFIAGPGVSGREILEMQTAKILEVAGVPAEAIEDVLKYNTAIYEIVPKSADGEKTVAAIVKAWRKIDAKLDDERRATAYAVMQTTPEQAETHLRTQLPMIGTPWFRHLVRFDPRPLLRKIDVPVLAILGGKDVQVPAAENAAALRTLLRAGTRDDVRVVTFSGLNHLMQTAETGAITEYGMIEETIAPEVLELISEWVTEQVGASDH